MTASWFVQALLLISSNVLLSRLVIATLEFSVLAMVVAGLIRAFHPRPKRIAALVILAVLGRSVLGLVIGTPLPLVALSDLAGGGSQPKLETMEMTIVKGAPEMTAGDEGFGVPPRPSSLDQPGLLWMSSGGTERGITIPPTGDIARAVVWIWALGVILTGLWFVRDRAKLTRLVRQSTPAADDVRRRYDVLAHDLGVSRPPQLYVTDQLESPALAGFFRTVVLVPSWMTRPESHSMLDWSLRHELIHRRHLDSVGGFVVTISKTLFFFNPLVWWLAGKWREETELACDEEVVRQTGDHMTYAENLYATLAHVHGGRRVAVGASLFATRTQIGKRIETLLRNEGACKKAGRPGFVLVAIVALASVVTGAEPGARAVFFHDIQRNVDACPEDPMDIGAQLADGGAFKLAIRGEYTLVADGSDIDSLTPGGRFEISEAGRVGMRKYTVTADAFGRLERTYSVDGTVQLLDDGGREWLISRLVQISRLAVGRSVEQQ